MLNILTLDILLQRLERAAAGLRHLDDDEEQRDRTDDGEQEEHPSDPDSIEALPANRVPPARQAYEERALADWRHRRPRLTVGYRGRIALLRTGSVEAALGRSIRPTAPLPAT